MLALGCAPYNSAVNPAWQGFYGLIGEFVVTTNGITTPQVLALHSWAMNRYHFGSGVQLNFIGDSISQGLWGGEYNTGTTQGGTTNWSKLVQSAFPGVTVNCTAESGQTSTTLLNLMSNSLSMQMPGTSMTIDHILWGANDKALAESQFRADTTNAITFCHSLGHYVIMCTQPSNTNELGGTFIRTNGNNFIWSLTNTIWAPDAIADYGSDPMMGSNTACNVQTALFNPASVDGAGGLHPTGLGYIHLSTNETFSAIAQVLGGQRIRW